MTKEVNVREALNLLIDSLREYSGEGKLSRDGRPIPCKFKLKILKKGVFSLDCLVKETTFSPLGLKLDSTFTGRTTTGLNVKCEGLVARHSSWKSDGTSSMNLVGTQALVHKEGGKPLRATHWLTNLKFQGLLTSQHGKSFIRDHTRIQLAGQEMTLKYAHWHENANLLRGQGNYSVITATLDSREDESSSVQDMCWLLSYATGSWVSNPATEHFDATGRLVHGEYHDAIQNRAAGWEVIPSSTPAQPYLEQFVGSGLASMKTLKKQYNLPVILGHYLESKATSLAELKLLTIAIAAEVLAADFPGSKGASSQDAFRRLWVSVGLPAKDKFHFWEVRDRILHTGTHGLGKDFQAVYYQSVNQLDQVILKLLGYRGSYLNCSKQFAQERLD